MEADPVDQEAYSHELISFGFWAGSGHIREPAFYSYTAPEPDALVDQPLQPEAAAWTEFGNGHLAVLLYEAVRSSENPRSVLMSFFQSAYQAGARTADWPYGELESRWCPADASAARGKL